MSILSTNKKLIRVGAEYSAGSGISIDDHVISVTGEFGKTYSAGENIDIYEQDEQLYISSKDWTNDIANASANAYNEAVAQIPDPFDPSYLSAQIDNKLDTTAFTTWQNGQYNTDLQTIEGQINNKLDESAFGEVSSSFLTAINIPESATWNEVSQAYEQASATYLTSHQSLEGYATEQWVEDKGYLTGVSIPESAVWQDVSTTVQSNSAQWAEGGSGDEEVNSFVYDNSATIVDVDTSYKANSGTFLTAAPADMATTGDVAELAQTISETYQVKGDYAERDFVLSSVESATSGKLDVSSFASVSSDFLTTSFGISESANWEEATNAYEQNSGTYLTAHQSLDGYATEDWVTGQGYITGVNIPESATWNEVSTTVQTNSSNWDNVSNKLDTTAFSDVSGTFLTAHQDLSDYYTTADADTLSSMLSGAIDYVSANAGDEFPISADEAVQYVQTNSGMIDETVTALQTNSSTYMVEPNLEYNAVNEISAYNGSAIAQYGAEKQWLVHDDTIVHISNSAQYAFGCNVSALQRLMGIDETVLWEGSANDGTLNFTDPLTSFKEFKFYVNVPERGTNKVLTFYDGVNTVTPGFIQLTFTTMTNGSVVNDWWQGVYNINATLDTATYKSMSIYANGQYYKQCSTTACGTNASKMVIKKVIGIGRKA